MTVFPAPMVQNQQPETGKVLRIGPDTAAPTGAATDRAIGIDVRNPAPGVGGSDGVHNLCFQDLGDRLPEKLHQIQGEAVHPDVVVFVKSAGILDSAGFAPPAAKLFDSQKSGRLAEHGAFPFRFLLEVVLPGDPGVVRGSIAAIVDIPGDGVIHVFNQTLGDSEATDGGEETLGRAINRVDGLHVAKGSDDVAVANDQTVRGSPLFGDWPQRATERPDLIPGEVPITAMGLCVFDRCLKFQFVKAQFGSGFCLPTARGRKILLRGERQGDK